MEDKNTHTPVYHFEGYENAVPIAKGGMATIWKARQISLDRWVAIKVLEPDQCTNDADIDQFQSEARIAARLTHPGIVPVYDAFYRNDRFCLVMAFVDGYTVNRWLQNRGRLSQDDCLFVAKGVAEALAYAWDFEQLVHCDIKPENIMIDADGSVKITDFGLSRSRSSFQTRKQTAGYVFGTPYYIAPEQATGSEQLTVHTDMYSLGASLYSMCTGTRLFSDQTPDQAIELQVNGQDRDPYEQNPSLSPFFCDFLEKLLCKEPEHRFASWEEVLEEINTLHKNFPLVSGEIDPEYVKSSIARCALREKARAEQLKKLGLKKGKPKNRPPQLLAPSRTFNEQGVTYPSKTTRKPTISEINKWVAPIIKKITQIANNRAVHIGTGVIACLLFTAFVIQKSQKIERDRLDKITHEAQTELENIDAYIKNYPYDYSHAIHRCNALIRTLENPAHNKIRNAARGKRETLDLNRKEAISRVTKNLREEINPLIEQRQFLRAASIVIRYDGPMAEETRRNRQALADHLTKRATQTKQNRPQTVTNE